MVIHGHMDNNIIMKSNNINLQEMYYKRGIQYEIVRMYTKYIHINQSAQEFYSCACAYSARIVHK